MYRNKWNSFLRSSHCSTEEIQINESAHGPHQSVQWFSEHTAVPNQKFSNRSKKQGFTFSYSWLVSIQTLVKDIRSSLEALVITFLNIELRNAFPLLLLLLFYCCCILLLYFCCIVVFYCCCIIAIIIIIVCIVSLANHTLFSHLVNHKTP